jgi:hypothetical protein
MKKNFKIIVAPSLMLEQLWFNSQVWKSGRAKNEDELIKGRIAAPVGTIRNISGTEYIKTSDGWRYHKKTNSKKTETETKNSEKVKDEEHSDSKPQLEIKTGHTLIAKDGTEGKIESVEGGFVNINYKNGSGEEKKAQLKEEEVRGKIKSGSIKHSPTKELSSEPPKTNQNFKEKAAKMHEEGVSSKEIYKKMVEMGADEDEIIDYLAELRKKEPKGGKPIVAETQKEESQEKPKVEETQKEELQEEDEIHEDHDHSVKHQAEKETNHSGYLKSKEAQEQGWGLDDSKIEGENEGEEDEDEETKDVNLRFDVLKRNIRNVVKGRMKSMIVYGTGGVGKTYTVTEELKNSGLKEFKVGTHEVGEKSYDYVKIGGKVTAANLYKKMLEHNGKVMVFDDCDSVLLDGVSRELFKNTLDTSGDGTVHWGTERPPKDSDGNPLPAAFTFTGKCIFISNLDLRKNQKLIGDMQPILSRGTGLDLTMSPKQTLKRIKKIAVNPKTKKLTNLKFPGITYKESDMQEILDYLDSNKNNKKLDLNVRTVGALLGIKKEAEISGVDWRKDADFHALKKAVNIESLFQK